MFESLTKNTIHQIDVVKNFLNIHDDLIKKLGSPGIPATSYSGIDYKVYVASSCLTRLYAIFENFIEDLISDYLDNVSELEPFEKLTQEFRTEYRIGISHILSRIDNARYSHLNHENVVNWYHEALNGKRKYKFVTEALTRHEQNLRLNLIESIFNKIDAKSLNSWLSNSPNLTSLYTHGTPVYEQLNSELTNFIQERNDAAHGNLSNIAGIPTLNRYCDLIQGLTIALSSFLQKKLLTHSNNKKSFKKIGKVTETFTAGAFVAIVKKGTSVESGTVLHFVGDHFCYSQTLNSIQIDGNSILGITAFSSKFEIGMKCDLPVSKKSIIYIDR